MKFQTYLGDVVQALNPSTQEAEEAGISLNLRPAWSE